ncbi:hypothetical protein [Devosia sp.]|uniref:hypothetical protein n=1 Tax=Devosia sp. TaxID=1871048 RepID=UPI0032644441
MNLRSNTALGLALIDDDAFSAQLLTRMLLAAGAPQVTWLGGRDDGKAKLDDLLATPGATSGTMLIVDLKASSLATQEFVASIAAAAGDLDLPIVAMAQADDRETRSALYRAGAAGVFVRHADRDAYRLQAAEIVSFWARIRRPAAVGM